MQREYAEIAVEVPVEGSFTYALPPGLRSDARVGLRALVPFGRRTVTGYIIGLSSSPPPEISGIKPVIDILGSTPLFDEKRLKFLKWVSAYYFAPLGEVIALTHPGSANIRSSRSIRALPGTSAGSIQPPLDREVFEAAARGVSMKALLKRFKGMSVVSAVARLKRAGLVTEEEGLTGGGTRKLETTVSLRGGAEPELGNAPAQRRVYEYLKARGGAETTLSGLLEELGEVRKAINALEEKGLVELASRQVLRDPLSDIQPKSALHEPNAGQKRALAEISAALRKGGYSPFLLFGVTGSGKTLVYLKALEEATRLGKRAIILAPEIALTPWPAAYLRALFPGRVALAHSGLSEGERLDEWGRIVRGEADIVVGARSALFSPLNGLGLIIVDEEHESSYKQEEGVRYNARDSALMLGKTLGITVVLGSATPSLETFQNALTGKIRRLDLEKRVDERALPAVELLDVKGTREVISEPLSMLMKETLSAGSQTLLFLNRRGFSSSLICRDCGHSFKCPNCSVTLTMHKRRGVLLCHYCDSTAPLPPLCPECSGPNLITPGAGTERVEEEVRRILPEARVGRMDRDTAAAKGSVRKIIEDVEERRLDVLVGTQMVSKGHHFPGVTLVGVISGDTSLSIPDFRSSERTFQLITQAAGRAGRGEDPGRVIIQSLNTGHYCLKAAAAHDYLSFFAQEIELRSELFYPPFSRLCALRVSGLKEDKAARAASMLKDVAERVMSKPAYAGMRLLGPAPALVARVKNRFRWQILIKASDVKSLHAAVGSIKAAFSSRAPEGVALSIDMDPLTVV